MRESLALSSLWQPVSGVAAELWFGNRLRCSVVRAFNISKIYPQYLSISFNVFPVAPAFAGLSYAPSTLSISFNWQPFSLVWYTYAHLKSFNVKHWIVVRYCLLKLFEVPVFNRALVIQICRAGSTSSACRLFSLRLSNNAKTLPPFWRANCPWD